MEHRMPFEHFEALLDLYGADLARWDEPNRSDALKLLEADATARAALESAQALDDLLDMASPIPAPSAVLAGRILAARPQTSRPQTSRFQASRCQASRPQVQAPQKVAWTSTKAITQGAQANHPRIIARMHKRRRFRGMLPIAALVASLVLGVVAGIAAQVVYNAQIATARSPSIDTLFSLGITTQIASLPLALSETIE